MPTRPGPELDLHLVLTTREGREKGLFLKYPLYDDAILTEFHARPVLLSDDGAIDDPARLIKRLNVLLNKVLGSKVVFGVSLRVNFNDELTRDVDVGEKGGQIIPYAFYNDSTGLAVAAAFLGKGYIQPQVLTVANAFVGSSGSFTVFLANTDMKIPWSKRLFVDQVANLERFQTSRTKVCRWVGTKAQTKKSVAGANPASSILKPKRTGTLGQNSASSTSSVLPRSPGRGSASTAVRAHAWSVRLSRSCSTCTPPNTGIRR